MSRAFKRAQAEIDYDQAFEHKRELESVANALKQAARHVDDPLASLIIEGLAGKLRNAATTAHAIAAKLGRNAGKAYRGRRLAATTTQGA